MDMIKPEASDFSLRLLAWFDEHKRDLPWRRDRRPYTVLLSEFMCQQTQVDTVIPYYEDFLRRWPQLEDLAAASEDELREAWAGLGYYRRASHLLACARKVVEKYDGQLPANEAALRELPGIGPYTAAAIASMAFGQPTAAIDGNLLRVLSRCFCIPWQAGDAASMKEVKSLADSLLSPERAGDFNEAMMDLGATICTPRKPDCQSCPFCSTCRARRCGKQEELPLKARSNRQKRLSKPYLLLFVQGQLYLQQRRESLLHGFYEYLPLLRPLQDGESVQLSALPDPAGENGSANTSSDPDGKSVQLSELQEQNGESALLSTSPEQPGKCFQPGALPEQPGKSFQPGALPEQPENSFRPCALPEQTGKVRLLSTFRHIFSHRIWEISLASVELPALPGENSGQKGYESAPSTRSLLRNGYEPAPYTRIPLQNGHADPAPLPSTSRTEMRYILKDSNGQDLCLPFTLPFAELTKDAPFRSKLCLSDAELNQENTLERPASGLFTKAEAQRLLPPFLAKVLDNHDQQG